MQCWLSRRAGRIADARALPGARGGLEWNELGSLVDRVVVIDLANGTVATAALEAVEPERLRIRHNIGGGEASYWIERDQITRIRPIQ